MKKMERQNARSTRRTFEKSGTDHGRARRPGHRPRFGRGARLRLRLGLETSSHTKIELAGSQMYAIGSQSSLFTTMVVMAICFVGVLEALITNEIDWAWIFLTSILAFIIEIIIKVLAEGQAVALL